MVTGKVRILLCEDHALFREGLRALMRDHPGIEVVGEAGDGRAAVDAAARTLPDVVILDIEMPELNGIEALRRIRRATPGAKVLVLTLYDDEEVVARCLDAGAAGYVLKDGPSSELLYAIQAVGKGERYLSPRALTRVVEYAKSGRTHTAYDELTDREREVLKLLADGFSVKQIAARLSVSVKTADAHKYQLMRKLDLHDRAALVKYAIRRKLIRLPALDPREAGDDASRPPAEASLPAETGPGRPLRRRGRPGSPARKATSTR